MKQDFQSEEISGLGLRFQQCLDPQTLVILRALSTPEFSSCWLFFTEFKQSFSLFHTKPETLPLANIDT